jgi:parvulin-like peptidyl-prolyl isomerase
MVCKYCGAYMEDDQNICPLCGGAQDPDKVVPEEENREETLYVSSWKAPEDAEPEMAEETYEMTFDQPDTEAAEELPEEENGETEETEKPKSRASGWLLGALIVVALAALVLAVVMVSGRHKGETTGDPTELIHVDEEGNFVAHSYTKPAADVTEEEANTVVATCGDAQLTNAELSYYYQQQYFDLINLYGGYISYLLDTEKPLSEQMYNEKQTWEDLLLQSAMTAFWQTSAASDAAAEAGYQLSEDEQTYVDSMLSMLEEDAKTNGFESVDAYIQNFHGPYTSQESYEEYIRTSFLSSSYLNQQFEGITYSEEDINNYFNENADAYAEKGLSIDDPNMVSVRHILITPVADENAEVDENGEAVLTEQNWTDAKLKAEEVLDMWQSGEATEDSFAALAEEYSQDPGSASNGGLYEDVRPGEMTAAFNDWCFDQSRQPGDTGIVETEFGYHIMYFSGTSDHAYWYEVAESDYVKEKQNAILDELLGAQPIEVDYSKVVLMETTAG